MLPYLLPLILILYGEFSQDIDTRFLGRVLFYTYTLSLVLPQTADTVESSILGSWAIFTFGIGYCAVRCRNWITRFCFFIAAVSLSLSSWSLVLNDFTLLLSIPYFADWSHVIIRESLITGLASFAIWREGDGDKDYRLVGYTLGLMCFEAIMV